ncbi:hypothetical protein Hanom_Chr10g00940561 [Helianthus anomalus]
MMRACVMLGRVISGTRMLPYFIAAAPAKDPVPSFSKKLTSSSTCLVYHQQTTTLSIKY